MIVRNSFSRRQPLFAAVLLVVVSFAQSAFAQGPTLEVPEDPAARVELLEKLFTAVEIAAAELPRDGFDPQAIVVTVGSEPQALFDWVRDNTYFVPYKGVLRGSTGVLMDRMGNSLDRALLLRELLLAAGHNAILATGTLTDEQAQAVLAGVRPLPSDTRAVASAESMPSIDEIVTQAGLDPATVSAWMANREQVASDSEESIRSRVEEQTSFLSSAAGSLTGVDEATERARQAALIRDHWWVEIQTDTSIIDLDPTMPDAAIGDLVTQPATRYDPPNANQLRGLPDNAHTVVVRLVVERWEAGSLIEEVALEHELFPAELYGQRVALVHVPLGLPADLDLLDHPDPTARLAELTADHDEWQPLLLVGATQVAQKSFTVAGVLKSEPGSDAGAAGGVGGMAGGMFGGFGGAMAGGGDEDQTHLTAEWIEYEIKTAGEGSTIIRREIFDLIGPAARQNGAVDEAIARISESSLLPFITAETEILAVPAAPDPAYYGWLTAQAVLANRDALLAVAASVDGGGDAGANVTPLPSILYSLALAADLLDEGTTATYHDRLSVYSVHQILKLTDAGFVQTEGLDIVADGSAAVQGGAGTEARLRRGVALTNAEGALLTQMAPGESGNAALLMAASPAAGIEWVAVRDEASLASLELPADVAARMRADLAAGYIVIAPRSSVPVADGGSIAGWWRLAASGEALGMGDRGWGQGLAEYIKLTNEIATTTACFLTTGLTANKDGGLKTAGSLLMCAVGLGLRTGGWISNGKALEAVGNSISLISTIANVASAVAGAK